MKVEILGGKSFSFLRVLLSPGEKIVTESGAMASMSAGVNLTARLNGGLISALLMKLLGKESLFLGHFSNPTSTEQAVMLTQRVPGEIVFHELKNGEDLYIQPGAFIACTQGVEIAVRWAGFASWLGGEGLFRLFFRGNGAVWYGAYGAVVEKEVNGEIIVDSGHLLSYPPGMKLKIKLAGGVFSSIFGGEGLVLKLEGHGRIKLQTRSIGGLASWLNPRFTG